MVLRFIVVYKKEDLTIFFKPLPEELKRKTAIKTKKKFI